MAGATIIPFPQARRLGRPALSTDDLRTIEAYYDAQGGQGAWRGFAPIGIVAVVLFTSYDRCPSLTLRRDSLCWYELAAPDGIVLRRGRSIEQVLRLFARAMNVG